MKELLSEVQLETVPENINRVMEELPSELQLGTVPENINIRKSEEQSGNKKKPREEQNEQIVPVNVRNENSHLSEDGDNMTEICLNGKTIKPKMNSDEKLLKISVKRPIRDTQMIILNGKQYEIPICNSNFMISHAKILNPQTMQTCPDPVGNESDESKIHKLKELISSLESYTNLLKVKVEQYENKKRNVFETERKEEPGNGNGNGGQPDNRKTTSSSKSSVTKETTSRRDAGQQSNSSQGGSSGNIASHLTCSRPKISDLSLNLEMSENFHNNQNNVKRNLIWSTPEKEKVLDHISSPVTFESQTPEDETNTSVVLEEFSSQGSHNSRETFDFALRVPDCDSDCRTLRF